VLTQRSPWCVQMDRRLVDSARLKKSLESPELDATAPSECVMRIGTDLFLIFQRRMTRPGRAPQPVGGAEPFPLFDTADCLPSTRQQAQLGNSRVNLAERCSYGRISAASSGSAYA
jgi:hypothetical protein